MNRILIITLNWLFLALLITMTIIARKDSFNTYQANREVQYNLFLPADYTFGIMNFICLVLIGFAIRATDLLKNPVKATGGLGKLALQSSPLFWLGSMSYTGWLFSWHMGHLDWALVFITILFLSLVRLFLYIQFSPAPLTYLEHVTLETPFVVFFSWVTFLYVSNIASFIAFTGWNGGPLSPVTWCCILVVLSAFIATWLSKKRPAYSMVYIWVMIGIYVKRAEGYQQIGYAIIAACAFCLVASAIGFWSRRKVLFA